MSLKIFKFGFMNEEQKEIIQKELYRLGVELDKLERTPRRGQQHNHESKIAHIEGEIYSFKRLSFLFEKANPNPIEQ